MKKYENVSNFDDLITKEYGEVGTQSRNEYEIKAQLFIISEMLKEARKEAKMTQKDLALKSGVSKSYISQIENEKVDIQLSVLIKIFESGLNRKIGLIYL